MVLGSSQFLVMTDLPQKIVAHIKSGQKWHWKSNGNRNFKCIHLGTVIACCRYQAYSVQYHIQHNGRHFKESFKRHFPKYYKIEQKDTSGELFLPFHPIEMMTQLFSYIFRFQRHFQSSFVATCGLGMHLLKYIEFLK